MVFYFYKTQIYHNDSDAIIPIRKKYSISINTTYLFQFFYLLNILILIQFELWIIDYSATKQL